MNNGSSCSSCVPTWKKILAFILDITFSSIIFGFLIAYFTGNLTATGFELEGAPALLVMTLILTYFIMMNRYFGGTIGKKIFGIKNA